MRRCGGRLGAPDVVEGDVGVTLGAADGVPRRLAVTQQDEASCHSVSHRLWETTSAGSSMDGQSRHSRSRA